MDSHIKSGNSAPVATRVGVTHGRNRSQRVGFTERGDAGLDLSWYQRRNEFDGMILITKRLSTEFIELASKANAIVHATITGWGGTSIEPNVMSPEESGELFKAAIKQLGADRVVLRIDPIIPTEEGIARAEEVYRKLHTDLDTPTRVRVSFLDNYPHVKARFETAGIAPLPYSFHAPLVQRQSLLGRFPGAEVCGEPGLECTGCLSARDLQTLGLQQTCSRGEQRKDCQCLGSKVEVFTIRGQCPHQCLYCYWK